MFCYRRVGHNESDEPAFTQPLMYKRIAKHPTTRKLYADRLVEGGTISAAEAEDMVNDFQARLESASEIASSYRPNKADWPEDAWWGLPLPSGDERPGGATLCTGKVRNG